MTSESSQNPLAVYSLAGTGNRLSERAVAQQPLLGEVTLKGETAVWYARPNTGKTLIGLALILEAVSERRIAPDAVFYVNADDTGFGLATKVQVLDDFGIHCLAPGHNGFKLSALMPAMTGMANSGKAHGTLIVIDTLKKVADLMSKRECREFGQAARAFSMAGGTLLGFAHTNKKRSTTEKLIYAGTTDILEDFDSAYLLDDGPPAKADERVVQFECIKRRGHNLLVAYYSYSLEQGLSYPERLVSVRRVDPEFGHGEPDKNASDQAIAENIEAAIGHGVNKKMQLVAAVGKATGTSKRRVLAVLEQFTGLNPEVHRWDYERREHGAHLFFLHPRSAVAEAA